MSIDNLMVLSLRHLDLPSIAWLFNNHYAVPVNLDSCNEVTGFILYPQYALRCGNYLPEALKRCLDHAIEKDCHLLCFEEYAKPDSDLPVFMEPRGVFAKCRYFWQKIGNLGYVRRCNEELTEFDVVQVNWNHMISEPNYYVNYFTCSLDGLTEEKLKQNTAVQRVAGDNARYFKERGYHALLPREWPPAMKKKIPWQVAFVLGQVLTLWNELPQNLTTAVFQNWLKAEGYIRQFIAPNMVDGRYAAHPKIQTMTTINCNLGEYRTVVVDVSTGHVLDKANGNGYTSVEKAINGWNYKHPEKKLPVGTT